MAFIAIFAVVSVLIVVNALYVVAEFATVSARRTRVRELAEGGNRSAQRLLPTLEDSERLDRYIAACQVGITISSLIIGFYGQARLAPILSPLLVSLGGLQELAARSIAVTVALILLTGLQVILGELVPKSIALRYPERWALLVVWPMRASLLVLRPFIALLNGSAMGLLRLFGVSHASEETHVHSPEELERLFGESARGGLLDAGEREMLENALRVQRRYARQIMIPRTRMVTAELSDTPKGLLQRLVDTPHTRFPVIDGSIDKVVGMIHLKDLFVFAQGEPHGDLKTILRELPLLPESITVRELWERLRECRVYMAVLFDEYGGTAGLVTLEDLMEEVVGELQDEFDRESARVSQNEKGRVFLRGDVLLGTVNRRFLLHFGETHADTIGGFMVEKLGREAEIGDELTVDGVVICVEEVEEHAVTRLSLRLPDREETRASKGESPAEPSRNNAPLEPQS